MDQHVLDWKRGQLLKNYDPGKAQSFEDRKAYYDALAQQQLIDEAAKKAQAQKMAETQAAPEEPQKPMGGGSVSDAASTYQSLQKNSAGGSGMSTVGNAMIAGSTMSGPAAPYLLGGGLALSTLEQVRANKQAQEDAKRQAYLDTIKNQQEGINRFQQIFSGRMV